VDDEPLAQFELAVHQRQGLVSLAEGGPV
jgi:hypothetical protein